MSSAYKLLMYSCLFIVTLLLWIHWSSDSSLQLQSSIGTPVVSESFTGNNPKVVKPGGQKGADLSSSESISERSQGSTPSKNTGASESEKPLVDWLVNKENSIEKRITRVSDIQNIHSVKADLLALITSKNPYAEAPRDPHTYNEYLYNREAALRVHSMKFLAEKLNGDRSFENSFRTILQNADDETIKTIAGEVLAYNQRGRSFFDDAKNGIRSLKPPQHKRYADTF